MDLNYDEARARVASFAWKNRNLVETVTPERIESYKYWQAKGYLEGHEAAQKEVLALVKALEYCTIEPSRLHPLNNLQTIVAMNALAAYKSQHPTEAEGV